MSDWSSSDDCWTTIAVNLVKANVITSQTENAANNTSDSRRSETTNNKITQTKLSHYEPINTNTQADVQRDEPAETPATQT